jgi:hypothetical protein
MKMRINANRAVAAVTAAAIALTTAGVAPAFAASKKAAEVQTAPTDISAHRYRRGYRYDPGAAAFAAIVGGIATYAAAREYRKSRERAYYNGYYGQPYGYYGNGGYYRPHRYYW